MLVNTEVVAKLPIGFRDYMHGNKVIDCPAYMRLVDPCHFLKLRQANVIRFFIESVCLTEDG